MNRRSVLFAMGATSLSAGAIFGSGAFTTIEADRSVELGVKGDGGDDDGQPQIGFSKGSGIGASNVITLDESNEVDIIKFEQKNLNERAKTSFIKALEVTNNGENEIDLYIESAAGIGKPDGTEGGDDDNNVLDFQIDDDNNGKTSIVSDGNNSNSVRLGTGDSSDPDNSIEVDIVINLRDGDVDGSALNGINMVTFVADAIEESEGN